MYSLGDTEINEKCATFVITLQNGLMSLEKEYIKQTIFVNAFHNCMFLPGDWYAGIIVLQSICKVFWDVLLKPVKEVLGWKQISKDVGNCYYQASRCVLLSTANCDDLVYGFGAEILQNTKT